MNKSPLVVSRGEVWEVRFDPSEGDEIRKIRPAVVMNVPSAGRMALQIVVPITGWQPQFVGYFWMVHLFPTGTSGLSKESVADAFQVKSVSINRFRRKIGNLNTVEINQIAAAIVICIGYKPQV
jgi:mRNA interferase MazF